MNSARLFLRSDVVVQRQFQTGAARHACTHTYRVSPSHATQWHAKLAHIDPFPCH